MSQWRAFVGDEAFSFYPRLRVARVADDDHIDELVGLTFERRQQGLDRPAPKFIEGPETMAFLQAMMDAAYEAGLRPSRAQDERHMKEHLKDMRTVAFHALGISGDKP